MNYLRIHIVFVLLLTFNSVKSQSPGFVRIDTIPVELFNTPIENPWAGGLNWSQFSAIDLNQDGIKDLFVFDRTGNNIKTFINQGTPGKVDYKYAPQYENNFPALQAWVRLVDYNCDGKEDIFTYSFWGGIAVYKNISSAANGLKFLETDTLVYTAYYPNQPLDNLYVSSVDIPAIADVDNDGDMDVLTLGIFGTTCEYHQNLSMETYGVCDSLNKFRMNTGCFGDFAESQYTNFVTLQIPACGDNYGKTGSTQHTLHSGSCQVCLDMNNDGVKDMIFGGIGFNNATLLVNGGTVDTANMIAKDASFPVHDVTVNLSSFPCGFDLDVNNDSLKDLLFSPNSPFISEDFNSVLYYKNVGTKDTAIFKLQQNNFLQDQMIEAGEGAYPVFFDYNGDGLLDLLIGNYGYYQEDGTYLSEVSLYKNIGTASSPKFNLVTRDFDSLSLSGLHAMVLTFGDLDGDGDADMIIGESGGTLSYYENTAGAGNPATFVLSQTHYSDAGGTVMNVGGYAAPQLVDVNHDGKLDLIIGAQNGTVSYYQNTGASNSPIFTKATSNFGGVNVTQQWYLTGHSYPCLYESGNSYKLLVGSELGYLYYYGNIDGNLAGKFTLIDSTYLNIWEGSETTPYIADINNDGINDMVIGNYLGGVGFYGGIILDAVEENKLYDQLSVQLYPNPATNNFTVRIDNFNATTFEDHTTVLKLLNLLGQEVLSRNVIGNSIQVSTSGLPDGMYLCEISIFPLGNLSPVYTASKKVVVENR